MKLGTKFGTLFCAAALCALALGGGTAQAASHSDAPLIKLDPQANITDLYAFIGTNRAGVKVLNAVVQVHPFSEPGDGAIYDKFSPDARYSINITNPATGETFIRYDFQFSPVTSGYKRLDTVRSYGQIIALDAIGGQINHIDDVNQNYTQTYSVTRVGAFTTVQGTNLTIPPPNVGLRVTPSYDDPATGRAVSGATSYAGLDTLTREGVHDLASGETTFCGSRDDGFFADIPGVFDGLNPRILVQSAPITSPTNDPASGVDGFKGYNVQDYAIQIPISSLGLGSNPVVGVYASVSRPRVTLRLTTGEPSLSAGPFVQVNRMAVPGFNEIFVALRDKDRYNATSPTIDANSQTDSPRGFATYALNPELAKDLNTAYGTAFQETNRTDLRDIFIPDVLKVDTSTEPVRQSLSPGFSRLSRFGLDMTANGTPSGFPNGRRFGDDVVDILLTYVANGPNFLPASAPVGDDAPSNDIVFNQVFPYAATPHAGSANSKDSGTNIGG